MAKKKKSKGAYTDEELLKILDGYISDAHGYFTDTLRDERKEVLEYYRAERPEQKAKGQSSWVSQDVYDSVEAMHAQLLETFTGSQQLVRFAPRGVKDVPRAEQMNEAVSYIVFRRNDGPRIISDVLKDGLMARNGVVKVGWEEVEEYEEFTVDNPDAMQLAGYVTEGWEIAEEYEVDEETGVETYTLCRTTTKAFPTIENIPPNEFLVSKRARSLKQAPFVAHRVAKNKEQLKKIGLTDKDISKLTTGSKTEEFDDEESTRFDGVDDGAIFNDPKDETWWVYECYIKGDFDGSGKTGMWMVTKVDNKVISKERVKQRPFAVFVPLTNPHMFHGDNFASRVIPAQKSKTALTRAVLEHTGRTLNQRLQVVRGTLKDARELQDTRRGGIINVNRPDGLIPLVQEPLNPFVLNIIGMIDQENEDITGISRISQGLNKDALSNQNSSKLVENLTSNSQIRQKVIAKNFAYGFLIPLYYLLAEIMSERATTSMMIEVAGEWQEVPPETWQVKRDLIAELHLGYGENDKEVDKWLMLHQLLSADPSMGPFYTELQKYNVYRKVLALKGVKDINNFLVPPQQAKPKPNPHEQLEIQLRQQELQLNMQKMQLEMAKLQLEQQEVQAKISIEAHKVSLKAAHEAHQDALAERQFELDKDIAEREMAVVEQGVTNEKFTAIASPNS